MNTQDQNSATGSPRSELETFNNPNPGRDYSIRIRVPEFTCLCPKTGQPDFATLFLDYIPEQACVELKSLKLYTWSYREEGAFHEAITNSILEDLVEALAPRWMRLTWRAKRLASSTCRNCGSTSRLMIVPIEYSQATTLGKRMK